MNTIQIREAQSGIPKPIGPPFVARYIYADDRMAFADIAPRGEGCMVRCPACGCPWTRVNERNRVICGYDRCPSWKAAA